MKRCDYIILGSGVAAGNAAREFVERRASARKLALITADAAFPYDRPPLSKSFLAGEKSVDDILINENAFYAQHGIDVITEERIVAVDFSGKKMRSESGEEFAYDRLLIATGSEPRRLNVPGDRMEGIHYLRSLRDSERIRRDAQRGRRAVVVGSGFIAMEVASVLARKGVEATMVFPQRRVWQKVLTPEMSSFFEGYFTERGVKFLHGESVAGFRGRGRVTGVELESGRELPADFVVAGIGVAPATAPFDGSRLQISNGIVVNEYLETSVPDVWAAGDVTNFPDRIFEKRRRVEHWDNAVEQGKLAAGNMLGAREAFRHVVYFFSDVFDISYEFWGDTADFDQVLYRGHMSRGSFSTWWLRDLRLVAAFILNRPEEEREFAPRWIRDGLRLDPELLQDASRDLRLLAAA